MILSEQLEIAQARETIGMARHRIWWLAQPPRPWWRILLEGSSGSLPPFPVHPDAVRHAEAVLAKYGITI